jgi:hypothetical protein
MRKNISKLQVAENAPNKVQLFRLTQKAKMDYILRVPQKANKDEKQLVNVRLVPTAEEDAIIKAGMKKHGLKKAVDVVRMALRRFAEAEDLKLKAS